jgi:hypothetical protein
VYTYDGHPVVRVLATLSRTLAELAANALRIQPRFRVIASRDNAIEFRRMLLLKRELTMLALATIVLLIAMAVQLSAAARPAA